MAGKIMFQLNMPRKDFVVGRKRHTSKIKKSDPKYRAEIFLRLIVFDLASFAN